MNDLITMPVHTAGAVDDYFLIESLILSTRTADAFKAIDRGNQSRITIWKLRTQLPVNSDSVRRFISRLSVIGDFDPPVCSMTSFGVDAAGVGFAVFPVLSGRPILDGRPEPLDAERKLIAVLRILEQLHQRNIVCGDLSGNSFWMDRSGDVEFIGVLGSFDADVTKTAALPPVETLRFLAPEARAGGHITSAADVFSIGVLAYELFTGVSPYGDELRGAVSHFDSSLVRPISSFDERLPGWASEVIAKCLSPTLEARYRTAGEALRAIQEVRARLAKEATSPVRIRRDVIATETPKKLSNSTVQQSGKAREQSEPTEVQERTSPVKIIVVMALVFFGVLFAGMYFTRSKIEVGESRLQTDLKSHLEVIDDPKLGQAVSDISEPKTNMAVKKQQFEEMSASDDPIAHALLVKVAVDAPSLEERSLAERSILDRAHRLGLSRSAQQVRTWLQTNGSGDHPVGYGAVLHALDSTMSDDALANYLKEAYPTNPRVVLRLAAALALDTKKFKEFQPILSQLLTDAMKSDEFTKRSTVALIIASPELSLVYGEELLQKKDMIPNEDLIWLLRILAERNDPHVKMLATLSMERALLSPLRQVFVSPLTTRSNLPMEVIQALIRASAGAVRKEDMGSFGRWYDPESEKVLLAICADEYSPEILSEAFDVLSGKSLSVEPAASFVGFIRKNYWGKRGDFVHAIGVLGNISRFDNAEIRKAVTSLDAYASDRQLIQSLLASSHPLLVRITLEKFPQYVQVPQLLELLSTGDKDIKLLALQLLKKENNVAALKLILQFYEQEKDPEIREVYEENFWVVRQRKP